ncbi:hypothetical protein ALC57_01323, partial [Trachymyrmex cornetzi]
LDILNELAKSGFLEIFLNLTIALQILLTVPMSEASFSKLKIIKNYLRNTMMQTRSCSLAMISIEKELVNSFDYVISLDSPTN